MAKTSPLKKRTDISVFWLIAIGLLLVALKLTLASAQRVYLDIQAPWDDTLMMDNAVSISEGRWLGNYYFRTLSKHSFFSLWLAFLNALGVPYLFGGQVLWALAAFAAAGAFAPALKKRWQSLALFGVLLFCPSSVANPEPHGYITRVYRDNIFPALCVLCIAGIIGYALRREKKLARGIGWLALCGAALGACWLTREDGWWLLPLVVVASVVITVYIVRDKQFDLKQKLKKCVALLLPFALVAASLLSWSAMNNKYYGRFIISDFSQGEFQDAYGAMTRIAHENWDSKIDVPRDVREKLYAAVPEFAILEEQLESEGYYGRYANKELGDYSSGNFYWALREAVWENGFYETPETARGYYAALAKSINALCDSGALPTMTGERSSVNPPFRAEYISPVLKEAGHSLVFCATFQDCDARNKWTPSSNDPNHFEVIRPLQEYLHEWVHWQAVPGTAEPVFTPWQQFCFGAFDAIRAVYAVALPAALLLALFWQAREGIALARRKKTNGEQSEQLLSARRKDSLLWWVLLGLWLCILLRALMIAYVTVSSFTIDTYIMYLASIHPMMLIVGFIGTFKLASSFRKKDKKGIEDAAPRRAEEETA